MTNVLIIGVAAVMCCLIAGSTILGALWLKYSHAERIQLHSYQTKEVGAMGATGVIYPYGE
jgi:hypothetical protein